MCKDCGCDARTQKAVERHKTVEVNTSVTHANDLIAKQVYDFFQKRQILCLNVMGSPGAGKTTIIENLARELGKESVAVIQGDLESDVDAKRLAALGIDAYQINTHSGCHLNAFMINQALLDMDFSDKRYVFIENVGNLVCPAGVKLGQHLNVLISSTTEGHDKIKKYPIMFQDADILILSKYDIKDAVEFDEKAYLSDLQEISSELKPVMTSKKDTTVFHTLAHQLEHDRSHIFNLEHNHANEHPFVFRN